MPVALSERDAFSYDKFTLTSVQATDSPGNRTFTLTKSIFLPELPETLEVLINGVKLKGDGTATAAGSGDEFYVNSATAPTTMTIETNAVLAAQTDSAVTTLGENNLLVIRRISNRTTKNIDYAPGSVIREVDLDNSNTQIIHIAQEAVDIALQGIILDADNKFDANDGTADRKIKNLEDGIEDDEAVNKGQLAATEVTTLAYKEDTEDYKLETADWATKVNGVVNTYTDNVAQSDGTDQSAKAYAIGGTGVTQTASKGAAKEWAIGTGRIDDQSSGDYSSKEWATGTTATSSKTYATKVDGAVTGTDFSSKAWAIGGTNVTTTASRGSAKEWATASGLVDTASYSAKEYSQSSTAGTSTYGGSAKGWASTAADTAVPGAGSSDRSALHYSTAASNSATAAKNSAAAIANSFDSFNDIYLGSMSDAVAFTANSSTDFLTSTAHGLVDTQQIQVVGSDLPSGLSASTNYFVRDKTTNTFKLAATSGGTAINIVDNGSGSTWIYGDFATPTSSSWAKNGSTITVASNIGIRVGQVVSGTGIPTSPKPNVLSIDGTAIVISENMAAAGSSVAVTFANKGVYGAFNTTKDGPSTDNDGDALVDGMLYFNSTDNNMMVYKTTGASWIKTSASGGVSLVMHKAVASGTPTSFAASDFTPTLSYEVNNIIVWLNGVKLDSTDYVATTGTTITDLAALANADELVVLAFKTFEVADAVSAASGGTFGGAVTCSAGLTSTTIDATTDFTIGGTVITNNTITDDGTLTITATTGITLGQDTALSAGKDLETSTTGKIKMKGSFMQSSTHQALTLGY